MIIRLNSGGEDIPFSFSVSSGSLDMSFEEVAYLGDVAVEGKLSYIGEGYIAEGNIRVLKKFTCDRCLKEVETTVNISFSEKFTSFEDENSTLYSGDEIDLSDVVRDNILSNEPIQRLCKDDCKGLCIVCGKDLNEGDCGCNRRIPDVRLSVLDDLKIE